MPLFLPGPSASCSPSVLRFCLWSFSAADEDLGPSCCGNSLYTNLTLTVWFGFVFGFSAVQATLTSFPGKLQGKVLSAISGVLGFVPAASDLGASPFCSMWLMEWARGRAITASVCSPAPAAIINHQLVSASEAVDGRRGSTEPKLSEERMSHLNCRFLPLPACLLPDFSFLKMYILEPYPPAMPIGCRYIKCYEPRVV